MGGFSLPSTSFLSSSSPPCGRSSRALGRGLTFLLIGTFLLGFVHFVKAETQKTPEVGSRDGNVAFFRTQTLEEGPLANEAGAPTTRMNKEEGDRGVEEESLSRGFWPAFLNSLSMILVTELGDKTFFIAAVLAMRYDRLLIFGGAISALIIMTILSAAIGNVLPNVLPRIYTHYASALLFLYFGIKLIVEARGMEGSGPSDELQEVEEELIHKKEGRASPHTLEMTQLENGNGESHAQGSGGFEGGREGGKEGGERKGASPAGGAHGRMGSYAQGEGKAKGNAATKVFTQALTLTFLAEWGDRSQIATIALAAAKDPYGVTAGGILGHSLCTGLAVLGGRMLAARISEKTVASTGGVLFLVFCAHSLIVGP
ncbi:hypothetical protein NSK_005424 [Nannochloropsis salina CCMP1776]|uniref:GDT1 family protein n=1 Tax=Nannochloropsis salina CCMP1776 TaxID=1027361 RepID=A0A4D9CVK3_9STRA|nr:hypothetical protein NSK_005424 [Nannochloropsis salina CCMP1776]|eukprot:TFJ83262.1 hypothetical protein NSK_005424 [Nannochloropsis salina CCMP1776]